MKMEMPEIQTIHIIQSTPNIEALRKENEELKARLEIDPSHPYDGIYTRDETIKMLEGQLSDLKAKRR